MRLIYKPREMPVEFGVGLIVFNLIAAFRKEAAGQEIVKIIMGVWLILFPFALGFSPEKSVMLNAIMVGFIVIILAVWQMFDTIKSKRRSWGNKISYLIDQSAAIFNYLFPGSLHQSVRMGGRIRRDFFIRVIKIGIKISYLKLTQITIDFFPNQRAGLS